MLNLVRGAKQVASLELALAGRRPPLDLIKKKSDEMFRKRILEINRRRTAREEFKPLMREHAKAVLGEGGMSKFTRTSRAYNDISKRMRLRSKKRRRPVPKFPRIESSADAGSLSWVKAAPYDFAWTAESGVGIVLDATADKTTGSCSSSVHTTLLTSSGGTSYSAVGTLFYSNQFSHSALFSAFTWRDWELSTWASGFFEDAHAEYDIFLDVLAVTGVDAGAWLVTQQLIGESMDSYWFSSGYDDNSTHQSFFASFPLYQGWYHIWLSLAASANGGQDAQSYADLVVPFVSMHIP